MNRIIVKEDKLLDYNDEYLKIENNNITFLKDNNYILEYLDCHNIKLNINLLDNIKINLYEKSTFNNIKVNNTYNLNNNSILNISKFYNNYSTLEKIEINLNKENSLINYNFSNICKNNEEYKIIINHNSSNTNSNIKNKIITINDSKLVMDLDSNLKEKRNKCLLNQDTRVIFFNENNVTIKPNMYIDYNDVIAKHSSVIGKFREEEIFYMMSRGIKYNDIIKLLTKGLIVNNLDIIEEEKKQIINIINDIWR